MNLLKKTKYVFRNPELPGELEREIIARNLVRSLEKIAKFQIEQLSGESWTHLRVHAPGKLIKLFTRISDKRLKPIIKGTHVYIYIDSSVTSIDVRMLVGELIKNLKTIDESYVTKLRKAAGLLVLKLAKKLYPSKDNTNG
jgi:hypothetical protein